jgi:hypothetical protein
LRRVTLVLFAMSFSLFNILDFSRRSFQANSERN